MTDTQNVVKENQHKRKKIFWKWDSAIGAPLLMAAAALICIAIGLMKNPKLYPVDYGQYEAYLSDDGLTWTAADLKEGKLQFDHPVTSFSYAHFSWMKMLTPSAPASTVYAAAFVRLCSRICLENSLSVDRISVFWALILAAGVYLITYGMIRLCRSVWEIPGIILCMIFTDGNFCAIFRGLYPQAAGIAFMVLFTGTVLWTCAVPYAERAVPLMLLCCVAVIFIKSDTPMLVFAPGILVLCVILLIRLNRQKKVKHSLFVTVFGLVIILTGIRGAVTIAMNDRDYVSAAAEYESVFNTMLPAAGAGQQAQLLKELQLDETYLPDIGKSFYEDENSYAHNPRNQEEGAVLSGKLTTWKVTAVYLKHPDLLVSVLQAAPSTFDSYENQRNMSIATGNAKVQTRTEGGIFALFRLLFGNYDLFVPVSVIGIASAAVYAFARKKYSWLAVSLIFAGGIMYLPFCIITNGYSLIQEYALMIVFLEDMLFIWALTAFVLGVTKLQVWVSVRRVCPELATAKRIPEQETENICREKFRRKLMTALKAFCGSQRAVTGVTLVLALFMLLTVFLRSDHPGCVNNGDFGRMMAQIGVTWTGDMYYNTDGQMSHHVIEEYEWNQPFDWKKLTPLEPTYSLYFFASVVRLFTEPFGRPLNTWYIALLMGGISVLCITVMTFDLFPFLKKYTLAAGTGLCMLLMGEVYLTWYDSLFGESCILIGMVMSLTCAIHLCTMKRKGRVRKILWYMALVISLYIMICAKAQMLTSVPFAVILLLAVAWYKRPYRYDFQVLTAVLAIMMSAGLVYGAVGTYRSDRTADSVSEKHTLWQAYFYGIFMISDDPEADMQKLGIDTKMAADIGKYVNFSDDSQYVYAPLSDQAQTAFYDHVSTFTILQWYITHPDKLYYMLDHAAKSSKELYTGFRVYKGQDYTDTAHDTVDGYGLWQYWRSSLIPDAFWEYIVVYLLLAALVIGTLSDRKASGEKRLAAWILLSVMGIGVMQYPMTVMGNGFADNQKQLFGFALCQDFIMLTVIIAVMAYTWENDSFRRFFQKR